MKNAELIKELVEALKIIAENSGSTGEDAEDMGRTAELCLENYKKEINENQDLISREKK